jgi:hypothetical protein
MGDWEAVAALTSAGKMHGNQGPAPTIEEMASVLRARIDFLLAAARDDLVGADVESVVASLMADRDHWKANHDNAVAIKAAVLDRPDLGDRAKRVQELIGENTILRGLVAQLSLDSGKPCHYCGENLHRCPRGFPGCALADDLMLAEHDALVRREKLEPKGPEKPDEAF